VAERDDTLLFASLGSRECDAAADVLARAFRDNPLNRAVIASDDPARRVRVNRAGMRALVPSALHHAVVLAASTAQRVAGVLIGLPPGRFPLPPPPLLRRVRCLWGQGWRTAARWGDVFRFLEERHPSGRHWYLATLGVDPELQRQGIGGGLLRAWLQQVDGDGAAAYLETDRRTSVDFYRRAGFELVEQTELLGAAIWRMHRPAAATVISTTPRSQ